MIKFVMILLLWSQILFSQGSLFSDFSGDSSKKDKQENLKNPKTSEVSPLSSNKELGGIDYNALGDEIEGKKMSEEKAVKKYTNDYMHVIFNLSQLTSTLVYITDESIIYSDISRLKDIQAKLYDLLESKPKKIEYRSDKNLTVFQQKYQYVMFDFYALSPYIESLIRKETKKTLFLIDYINKVHLQLSKNIVKFYQTSNKIGLNQQQNQYPFMPKSPEQTAFLLESQLNGSLINMIMPNGGGSNQQDAATPYSSIARPANADVMSQMVTGTPNMTPLGLMNNIPYF